MEEADRKPACVVVDLDLPEGEGREVLKASAPARIINVTSSGERSGTINFDDLQGEGSYSGFRAYNQSKLSMILFTYELARRLEGTGVSVNCVHPGVVATNLGRGSSGLSASF